MSKLKKALKRKAKGKKDGAFHIPPSKKAAIDIEEFSSDEFDELNEHNDPIWKSENSLYNGDSLKKNEILSIEMKFISSLKDLKNKCKVDPGNWTNHFDIFENNFVSFLNESVESSNSVPSPITIDDVKTLIDASISSKIETLLKTSNPIISSPISNSGVKSFASIANQGYIANANKANTSSFSANANASPFKQVPQSSFFVQIHDNRPEPLSGMEIWQLTKSLIDPISLNIRINNVFINKQGKVLFYLDSLKDQTALFNKLNCLQNEVLKLLTITQKKDQKAKIIITNVDNSVSSETIFSKILGHDFVKPFVKDNDNITLIKRTKGNGLHSAIICEISKELKEKIISIKRLWFGYFTAYIKTFIRTKQCFNCAQFGHFKNCCTNNPACILCSGPHSLFDCPSKDSNKFKCVNCIKSSNPRNLHSANSLKCPEYLAHFNSLSGQN